MTWEETGLPWIAPSPNMPTPTTALVYPGGCLVEATELSEGRGTTRPFQLTGAPFVDPKRLADELNGRGLPGVTFVPTYFRPQFQKHRGAVCGGVELLVTDPDAFRSYRTGVELLDAIHRLWPDGLRLARGPLRVRLRPPGDRPAHRRPRVPAGDRERRGAGGLDRGLEPGRAGVPRRAPGDPALSGEWRVRVGERRPRLGDPSPGGERPPPAGETPPPTRETPPPSGGDPCTFWGDPSPRRGTPLPGWGTPVPTRGDPSPREGDPSPTWGTPPPG